MAVGFDRDVCMRTTGMGNPRDFTVTVNGGKHGGCTGTEGNFIDPEYDADADGNKAAKTDGKRYAQTESDTTDTAELIVQPDQNIPHVIVDQVKKAHSEYTLYEDEDYIYYLWRSHGLFSISKHNGSVDVITKCRCFAVYDGNIYFGTGNEIKAQDMETGVRWTVAELRNNILGIACSSDKIYFTREADWDTHETCDVLCVIDKQTEQVQKCLENVHTFCVYDDRVFFVSMGELGYIREYLYDGPLRWKELHEEAVDFPFDIFLNKVYCYEYKDSVFDCSGIVQCDINTEKTNKFTFNRYYNAIYGLYMIYDSWDEDTGETLLIADDIVAGNQYILLNITNMVNENDDIGIHTVKDTIYLCIDRGEALDMYSVSILDGKAVINHAASLKDESGQ